MPTLLEAPETEPNPFADLIGGEGDAPAYQVVGGEFSEVPKAEIDIPTDYGAFADLLPDPLTTGARTAGADDFGDFLDLVPTSPTSESEKALAETTALPKPDSAFIQAEKGVSAMPGMSMLHPTLNAVRVFGSAAGRYIFHGLQGLEIETAKALRNPPSELTTPQAEAVLLPPDQQEALENRYIAETQAAGPDALARAEYWKGRAEKADEQSEVDPELANTIPARLSAAAGQATAMGMEALIPGAGLPLMVLHGALATEAEALNAGQTPEQAEAAATRSAIGLAIFGGVSKVAALGVAKLLPKVVSDPGKLVTFVAQFTGQEAANETSSRAIAAWNAAEMAPAGKKTEAAIEAFRDTTLEGTALNAAFALLGASKAAGLVGGAKRPTSNVQRPISEMQTQTPARPVSAPIPSPAPAPRLTPETARYVEPARQAEPANQPADVMQPVGIGGELDAIQIRSATKEVPRPLEAGQDQPGRGEGVGRGEQRPEIAGARAEETAAVIPEYLRPDPEVQRLLAEPAARTGPQMKMAAATEGGALFSRGGARAAVVPKGATPKGDTQFLRIEPGWKRLGKGLERKGAADVLADTKNKVGQLLSKAARKHVDTEQEIYGQLYSKFDQALQGPRKTVDAAFDELTTFLAARENGRPVPVLSAKAQKILTAWEDVAESTGNLARANDVQVFDPTIGKHRPMGNLGRTYLPRVMKPEVERVMQDPKSDPRLWNDLVDAFAKHRGISDIEAGKELRAEAGRFSSNDFMGNLERARTGQLPEIFYDYDLRRVASRYIPNFAERMGQIIAYGQRLGPREQPSRPNLWDIARGEAENAYTQTWLTAAEDQAVNLRAKTASGVGMARAQTLGSGLLLSSPTTSVMRNTLSGLSTTVEVLGGKRAMKPLVQAVTKAARTNAKEMGAVRENIGDFLHADKLGQSMVDDAVRAVTDTLLKYSGYNGSEVFVRTHAALTAAQFAKDGVAAIAQKPSSMRGKEALGLFQRMGVSAEKIVAEGADWRTGPETRKFIRTVIRDTQGGYRFDQVPLWANSNMGRFFYQFGRWGTQRARNIWKNGIKPALGEEVTWKGKTMTRRDVRPLLKMAAGSVLLGEAFGAVAAGLFGRDRRDASLSEIAAAWKEDEKLAVGLAFERAINDIIMAGTMGIWGQPIDWAKSLKNQSRLKNPTEPPGMASTKAVVELGQAMLDQEGQVTRRDLLKFAGNVVPGAKQLSDVARNVMDEPLYEAENDVKTLRSSAVRWAKQEGLDVSPRAKGDFRKSAKAPEYEPIKEALLVGDAAEAKVLAMAYLDQQESRSKAATSLRASVKNSQPFRAGPYTAEEHRVVFKEWARKNLSDEDYQQTERIQQRYVRAAVAAGLW